MIDEILQRIGLKYEELSPVEKETLNTWVNAISQNQLTIESIKTYISAMRESVESELTQTNLNDKQDAFLKARLRNYILLENMLTSPEKAKAGLERAVAGIASGK